jgi:arabinogalactan endo-1,4-beta-galactosidase
LTTTVHDYTRQVLAAFASQGAPVGMVSIGNEIRNGILWPIGKIDWAAGTGWDNLGEPEWIPGVGWEPGAGTPNDNLTLFSFTGQALPSVGLFQSPLAVCAAYDPALQPCEIPNGASVAPAGF